MKTHWWNAWIERADWVRVAVVIVLLAALGLGGAGSPAVAASGGADRSGTGVPVSVLAALQRDLGLSAAGAQQLLVQQTTADELNDRLSKPLGASFAGSWFDPATGRLVVAVTDAERADLARKAGADSVVVKHSKKALDEVKADLDTRSRQHQESLTAATSWSVDVRRNQVVMTVHKGQSGTFSWLLSRYGDMVRVEESDIAPTLTTDFLDGGDAFNGCSVGFNVTLGGVGHFLTAGHCGTAGRNAYQNGVLIGPFVESWFPGEDDALVRNDNSAYWIQGPWVFAYNGDPGAVFNIRGYKDSLSGTAVCKSGKTTKLTCGRITGKEETVRYDSGTVYGLTRHSACAEPGDSGGSNYSTNLSGNWAEGMTSGASLIESGGRKRCRNAVLGVLENISWYYPIYRSINYYGVALMTG